MAQTKASSSVCDIKYLSSDVHLILQRKKGYSIYHREEDSSQPCGNFQDKSHTFSVPKKRFSTLLQVITPFLLVTKPNSGISEIFYAT